MAIVQTIGEQRFLFERVNWRAYEALLATWADLPVRMTYDRGRLEIMSPLLGHEQYGTLIARIIETLTLELRIRIHSGGSTTFRQFAKERGLEPDECYWIRNEARMRSRKDYDPETDPPPDLAVEVDITSSSLDRMSIYASLGVPEVWRFDGETLTVHQLEANGEYTIRETSAALPGLPPQVVKRFLRLSDEMGETELLAAFLDWVRAEVKSPQAIKPRKKPRKK